MYESEITVRYKFAKERGRENLVFSAWLLYRAKKGNFVDAREARFVAKQWAKPSLDLIIRKKDYDTIFAM